MMHKLETNKSLFTIFEGNGNYFNDYMEYAVMIQAYGGHNHSINNNNKSKAFVLTLFEGNFDLLALYMVTLDFPT